MLDKKYSYINYRREEIMPICCNELERFNVEVAFFKWSKKRGYFNRNGEVVAGPTNQYLPKKEITILKSKFAKGESRKITKQQLENPNHSKSRRKRKRTKTEINDK